MSEAASIEPHDVLEYWFGHDEYDDATYRQRMNLWFYGGEAVDGQVRARFGAAVELAATGALDHWATTARGSLALVVLLDQFPRNMHRGTPQAYAYDELARDLCLRGLGEGLHTQLGPAERAFYFLPLQHAESLEDQQRCVAYFEQELAATPEHSWYRPHAEHALEVAKVHERIIRRYGRYPHRNEALGRPDTLDERMYLDAGGPAFGQERSQPQRARTAEFRIHRPGLDPADTLCVDGFVVGLRCLSHWPGSNPPPALSHDLSTGMALRWARLSPAERTSALGPFSVVTNDHYDTDGALAAFALLHPERALEHEDLMVRTAATGDFRTWNGEDALAIDLTIWALRDAPRSPLAGSLATVTDYDSRAELCYRHAIAHLHEYLREPFALREVWAERFDRCMADLRRVETRSGVQVEHHEAADLAVVRVREPLARIALIHAAGEHSRVLLVHDAPDGPRYRFLYRNESWFIGVRDRLPPRRPLQAVVAALQRHETSLGGQWWSTTLEQTSPQLGFGSPGAAADIFGDLRPDLDPASALPEARVVRELCLALQRPAPRASSDSIHRDLAVTQGATS
ncbi:MAG: DUF924 family protein [Myxococcota bacterium]